ncbi:MAG: hypothetical protein ACRDE2_14155 [Chitinophagaceae bacterium]
MKANSEELYKSTSVIESDDKNQPETLSKLSGGRQGRKMSSSCIGNRIPDRLVSDTSPGKGIGQMLHR